MCKSSVIPGVGLPGGLIQTLLPIVMQILIKEVLTKMKIFNFCFKSP